MQQINTAVSFSLIPQDLVSKIEALKDFETSKTKGNLPRHISGSI
jgi:hypothetical protein